MSGFQRQRAKTHGDPSRLDSSRISLWLLLLLFLEPLVALSIFELAYPETLNSSFGHRFETH